MHNKEPKANKKLLQPNIIPEDKQKVWIPEIKAFILVSKGLSPEECEIRAMKFLRKYNKSLLTYAEKALIQAGKNREIKKKLQKFYDENPEYRHLVDEIDLKELEEE